MHDTAAPLSFAKHEDLEFLSWYNEGLGRLFVFSLPNVLATDFFCSGHSEVLLCIVVVLGGGVTYCTQIFIDHDPRRV